MSATLTTTSRAPARPLMASAAFWRPVVSDHIANLVMVAGFAVLLAVGYFGAYLIDSIFL